MNKKIKICCIKKELLNLFSMTYEILIFKLEIFQSFRLLEVDSN